MQADSRVRDRFSAPVLPCVCACISQRTRHSCARICSVTRHRGTRPLGSVGLFPSAGAHQAVSSARPEHMGLTDLCCASCQVRIPQSGGTRRCPRRGHPPKGVQPAQLNQSRDRPRGRSIMGTLCPGGGARATAVCARRRARAGWQGSDRFHPGNSSDLRPRRISPHPARTITHCTVPWRGIRSRAAICAAMLGPIDAAGSGYRGPVRPTGDRPRKTDV